jgi:hypothetical protein
VRTPESIINRYYDPTTDQFLSIDPDVATTEQPYVFTNDDPLNAEDPLGLKPAPKALSEQATANDQKGCNSVKACTKALANALEGISGPTGTVAVAGSGFTLIGLAGLPEDGLAEAATVSFSSAMGYVSAATELSACALNQNLKQCTTTNLALDATTLVSPPIIDLIPVDERRAAEAAQDIAGDVNWLANHLSFGSQKRMLWS